MGLRIKELIKEKGYTQQDFADKLGMSRVGLSQLINGKPSYVTLEKFADVLSCDISELFERPAADVINCPYCGGKIKVVKG